MASAQKLVEPERIGFEVFLRELKQELGTTSPAAIHVDHMDIALSKWTAFGEEEKRKYDARARSLKSEGARNCFGQVVAELEAERFAVAMLRNTVESFVEDLMNNQMDRNLLFKPFSEDGFSFCVASASFYIPPHKDKVHPLEFSLCRATFKDGVLPELQLHRILKLVDLNVADVGIAKDISANSHKIPLNFPGCDNFKEIVDDIKLIIGTVLITKRLPVFAHPQFVDEVATFLRHAWKKAGDNGPPPFVCSIKKLAALACGDEDLLPRLHEFFLLGDGVQKRDQLPKQNKEPTRRVACDIHEKVLPCHPTKCTFYQVRDMVCALHEFFEDHPATAKPSPLRAAVQNLRV